MYCVVFTVLQYNLQSKPITLLLLTNSSREDYTLKIMVCDFLDISYIETVLETTLLTTCT